MISNGCAEKRLTGIVGFFLNAKKNGWLGRKEIAHGNAKIVQLCAAEGAKEKGGPTESVGPPK